MFDIESHRLHLWKSLREEANNETASSNNLRATLKELGPIETLWAYPGPDVLNALKDHLHQGARPLFRDIAENVVQALETQSYRGQPFTPFKTNLMRLSSPLLTENKTLESPVPNSVKKPYFEVLVIHPSPLEYAPMYHQSLAACKTDRDEFLYDVFFERGIPCRKII